MSNFRNRLDEEVNRLGITAIATTLGIARNTLYNWLSKGNVPLNMLMALGGLGVDVQYIVTGDRSATSLGRDEAELLELYRAAPVAVKLAAAAALSGGSVPATESYQGSKQVFNQSPIGKVFGGDLNVTKAKPKREK